MMNDLKQYKLGDVANSQTGPFGSQLHEEDYVAKGTPIVTVEHLGPIGFTHQNLPFVSDEDTKRLNKYILKEGDIVFSRVGSIDRSVYVRAEEEGWLFSGRCIRVRCNNSVNPRYLSFYFRLPSFKKMMLDLSVGATMPSLNTEIMDNLLLYLPNKEQQDIVAKILDDIDTKIENNNAICADLEGMAKLLYDYWFVQFDFPDENGKPYKSSGGKMVWNEELKREIPEGWTVVSYRECIQSVNTGLNPRDNFKLNTGGNIRYLTVKNLTTSGNIDFASCDFIDDAARNIVHRRSDISIGDVLFASIAPLGRCFLIDEEPTDWDINESVFSIRPNYQRMTSKFLYMTFMGDSFIKKATNSSTGSVFKGIRINDLMEMKTILPPMSVLQHFDEKVEKLFATKSNCVAESVELTSMRDFLLPMLMNGQVKVKGA